MKKLSVSELSKLSIIYREYILLADVVEKSRTGVWIETLSGERTFITRYDIQMMLEFVSKCL